MNFTVAFKNAHPWYIRADTQCMHMSGVIFVTDLRFRPSNQHTVETDSRALRHLLGGGQKLGEHGALHWGTFNVCRHLGHLLPALDTSLTCF